PNPLKGLQLLLNGVRPVPASRRRQPDRERQGNDVEHEPSHQILPPERCWVVATCRRPVNFRKLYFFRLNSMAVSATTINAGAKRHSFFIPTSSFEKVPQSVSFSTAALVPPKPPRAW